jgi:integrase
MLKELAPRAGFPEHSGYQNLRAELTEHLRPVLAIGYYSRMRISEVLGLRWSNVDPAGGEIRLEAGKTKNGEGRTVPIAGELLELLRGERQRHADAEHVFTHEGDRIKTFYQAWRSATKRAGLEGLLYHDLRRTGVGNLVRAGVPERVTMAISGHKTRAVSERYNIVSGRHLKDAASKLETYLRSQNGQSSGKECTDSGAAGNDTQIQATILQ